MFINDAFAATSETAAPGGTLGGTLIQLALILLIFYFFLIRPQKKRMNEHAAMVDALKVGDDVLLSSGIYGKITKIQNDKLLVKIAPNVEITVDRMTVGTVVAEPQKTVGNVSKVEKATQKIKKGK